jgi:lipoprotein-anchoring transpeptidase ErfK/SrfK
MRPREADDTLTGPHTDDGGPDVRHTIHTRTLVTALAVLLAIAATPTTAFATEAQPSSTAALGAGVVTVEVDTERVAGSDRWSTSVAAAADAFPGWEGVEHVVVASGDDEGTADALAASGLCWVYDAPLLLTGATTVPAVVADALRQIVAVNGEVSVHIVGGRGPVPEARFVELEQIVGVGRVDRVAGDDRYQTAAEVAYRMAEVSASSEATMPSMAVFASGEAPTFADALVLSSVTAATGAPLLLVRGSSVPWATGGVVETLGIERRFVAGGVAVVSDAVVAGLRATRWAGSDRFGTAVVVAQAAAGEGWVGTQRVALAAKVPDALSGGVATGRSGAALLLTETATLPKVTASHVSDTGATSAIVYGGPGAVSDAVVGELGGAPSVPVILGGSGSTDYVAAKTRLAAKVGVNTSHVEVYKNGHMVSKQDVASYSTVDLGELPTDASTTKIRVVAFAPDGGTTAAERSFTSLGYAWDTYIVIDKSDFTLYFVKNGVLDSTYPIAIGKPGWETPVGVWRIDSKYHTSPGGVFGPRKMRMYRRYGSAPNYRYAFTPYNIHGTNQEWVIGTKASHGCIRLYNRDILDLFPKVPLGTMVVTRQ